ncbi:MAG TPA: zinc dependent phospholipase C family protein [Candidatus Acidoferrum sp.]
MNCKSAAVRRLRETLALVAALALLSAIPERTEAYSVMSHQAIIDVVWESSMKPALRKRFPNASEDDINRGQAYAYGGAIIQDLGYYPGGNPFFSDVTHYVRSADFVFALLRDSQDIYEYSFALGAMAHYAADNNGHRTGTNRAVPVLYPKLQHRFGDFVTYEDDKLAHIKTEFGFDVLEVAKERYAPESYHDYIGFEVSPRVLDQAFQETYGLDLKKVLHNQDHVFGSYRYAVSNLLPKATRIAWHLKRDEIQKDEPGITKSKFLYNLRRSNYEKEWGKDYDKPKFSDKVLAFIYKLLPKIGPLRVLQFKTPTPATEQMFEASFNETLDEYRLLLKQERETQSPTMANDNFDLGQVSGPGKYHLCDTTHARLLDKLAEQKFAGMTPEIRAELLDFFNVNKSIFETKKDKKLWAKVPAELEQLKSAPVEQKAAGAGE